TSSGGTVTLSTNLGTLSSVTNNNNGTYTATLTGTQSGTATISGIINGSSITSTATVTLTTAPFGAPPSFVAAATSTSQVNLSWAAVSGATSYQIFRATTLAAGYLFLAS